MKKFFTVFILFYFSLFTASPAMAQTALEEEVRAMKEQFNAMQKRMGELENKVASQDEEIAGQKAEKEAYAERIKELEEQLVKKEAMPIPPAAPTQASAAKWLPEIGVVADIVYTQNSAKEDEEGADRISARELELVLGSNVDPYSRLDATIAFSDTEDPALEEAYLTRFDLPLNTTARLGEIQT